MANKKIENMEKRIKELDEIVKKYDGIKEEYHKLKKEVAISHLPRLAFGELLKFIEKEKIGEIYNKDNVCYFDKECYYGRRELVFSRYNSYQVVEIWAGDFTLGITLNIQE